jgi:phage gp16-like protein
VIVAVFGVLGVLITLAWLEYLAHRARRAQLKLDCKMRGHQWKQMERSNFAVNPDYTGYIRYCRHCGAQQHEKVEGGWH